MSRTSPRTLLLSILTAAFLVSGAGCVLHSFLPPPELKPEGYCLGQGGVFSLAFSPDGKQLASTHVGWLRSRKFMCCQPLPMTPQVRVWETGIGPGQPQLNRAMFLLPSNLWAYPRAQFSPDGSSLFVEESGHGLVRWNLAEQRLETLLEGRSWILLSSDGRTVVAESGETAQRRLGTTFAFYFGTVSAVTNDAQVELLDLETGTVQRMLRYPGSLNVPFAFTPDGKTLAFHAEDRKIAFMDIETGLVRRPTKPIPWNWLSAFSHDSRRYAAQSPDGTVQIWDIATGTSLNCMKVGSNVNCLAFSPDGALLAVGREADERGGDVQFWEAGGGDIQVWDIANGQLRFRILDDSAWGITTALCFSPDGATLASGHERGDIKYWPVRDMVISKSPIPQVRRAAPTP